MIYDVKRTTKIYGMGPFNKRSLLLLLILLHVSEEIYTSHVVFIISRCPAADGL